MKRAFVFLLALPFAACAATSEGPALVAAPGQSVERLEAGRTLFGTHCQNCHALPHPSQLSASVWPAEVAGMARKSGLSSAQVTLVADYLVAASRAVR
jgi:mono/diheme cytochrome c family protein